jgi:hypothetical protein
MNRSIVEYSNRVRGFRGSLQSAPGAVSTGIRNWSVSRTSVCPLLSCLPSSNDYFEGLRNELILRIPPGGVVIENFTYIERVTIAVNSIPLSVDIAEPPSLELNRGNEGSASAGA